VKTFGEIQNFLEGARQVLRSWAGCTLVAESKETMIHVEQHGPVLAIRMARGFLGRPLAWTTAYWVDGLLIDTGPRCAAPELLKVLSQLPVNQIVVTHSHEDNIGGLEDIHAHFRHAPIYASYRALQVIQEPTRLRLQLYRRLVWGVPKAIKQVRALDDVDNTLRTSAYTFRIIETPGHSRDHISLFEPTQRWLFFRRCLCWRCRTVMVERERSLWGDR
jgi:glyoxylase-like metal-dependent hydrolase (beta-lactamase superfamily II)